MLEARAFTGEPLYALSCLFLTCSGGPEEAGAPPDMLGKSKEKKNKVSLDVEGAAAWGACAAAEVVASATEGVPFLVLFPKRR